ncbi:hypothetical protein [Albibacillus kandeliae]|uniref:hypothetical protein n=1 Tax=Albibacillus kandeliae TaxID=2174228 RepID=UPI000D686ABB|nr:hypothetical protein [Albibacillus kandeliae]
MKKVLLQTTAAIFATAALAAPVFAASQAPIHEVSVTTDYSGLEDSNAKDFYPTISEDLMTAIAERIQMSDDPTGYTIDVTIQSVNLDGETVLPENKEFNSIDGVMNISAPDAKGATNAIPIKVRATTVDGTVPEGYSAVAPSDSDFYQAMIQGYADAVVEKLPDIPTGTASK